MRDRRVWSILALLVLIIGVVATGVWWSGSQPLPEPSPEPTLQPFEVPVSTLESPEEEARFTRERQHLVKEVEAQGIEDPEVIEAIETVPRHLFVPQHLLGYAYLDRPLPIGYGQTISQPYIVALMTELLELHGDEVVLEVGTGSGYQAAVLSDLVKEVYTMEIIPELAHQAEERLARLGYANVHARNADGYYGWEEHAPFDDIIVTAAPDHVPQPLVAQLKDGGRLVIPVGAVGAYQTLWQITKKGDQVISNNMGAVVFVPLTGEH